MKESINATYTVIAVVLLLAVAGIVAVVWTRGNQPANGNDGNTSTTSSATSSDNNLVAGNFIVSDVGYVGENKWEYVVTGTMPTPCHKFSVDAVVQESFPEQVILQVRTIEPTGDEVCIQIVDEQQVSGTFIASEGATVRLQEIVE